MLEGRDRKDKGHLYYVASKEQWGHHDREWSGGPMGLRRALGRGVERKQVGGWGPLTAVHAEGELCRGTVVREFYPFE